MVGFIKDPQHKSLTDAPGVCREIHAKGPGMSRMVKVVIYGAADRVR